MILFLLWIAVKTVDQGTDLDNVVSQMLDLVNSDAL